jgi:flagellin
MSIINTNLNALKAQNALTFNGRALQRTVQELSTGLRVNTAADNAAGLAIGNRMSTQILGLNQAIRNANDGISMMQTADGASQEIDGILVRMRELAIQAANGTNGDTDLTALNSEFSELQTGISTIVGNTSWNNIKVLDGSAGTVNYQVGPGSNDSLSATFADLSTLGAITTAGITSSSDAWQAISDIDASLTTVNQARSSWGAKMNRMVHSIDNAANVAMNLNTSKSRIMDTDYAKATSDLAKAQILQNAGTAMLSQANQRPFSVLRLLR